ncbi:MAG TPA: FAD:protein FMN transferase [Steroidobacter sp.]
MNRRAARLLFVVLASLIVLGCSPRPEPLVLTGPTMGTTYTIKITAVPEGVTAKELRTTVEGVLAEVDRSMSGYRADSEISRFNAATTTDWVPVSGDLAHVVQAALEVSRLSEGAFDVTVGPLVEAWGFGPKDARSLPDAAELERAAARIGYRKLHVREDPPALRKDTPELAVDLNAIAPGFAVDRIAERLLALGIESYMVEIGGEVRARGRNARGEAWRIAIERPSLSERAPFAIVPLSDAAIATSGEYRDFYVNGDERYSHTIDPRTSRPIEHGSGSVVVIHEDAMHADAWATALNVLGLTEGLALARRLDLAAMFLEDAGDRWRGHATLAFRRFLHDGREGAAALEVGKAGQ